MDRKLTILFLGLAFLFSSCSLAPEYQRPEALIPGSWPEGEAFKDAGELSVLPEVKDLQWQQFFTDEKLKTIIGMALQNNLDLQLAVLNMERARAMYGVRRAELFPAVDASGTGGKERRSADLIRSENRGKSSNTVSASVSPPGR